MKKRRLLVLLGVALVASILAYFLVVAPWLRLLRISRENYDRIQLSMTEEEVQAVLGLPPGHYSTGDNAGYGSEDSVARGGDHVNYPSKDRELTTPGILQLFDPSTGKAVGTRHCWTTNAFGIWVDFDPAG